MCANDAHGYREAEALTAYSRCEERVEDFFQHIRGDAGAVIAYFNVYVLALGKIFVNVAPAQI